MAQDKSSTKLVKMAGSIFAGLMFFSLMCCALGQGCLQYTYTTSLGRQLYPGVTEYKQFTTAECMEACTAFLWCNGIQMHLETRSCQLYVELSVSASDRCCVVASKKCLTPAESVPDTNTVQRQTTTTSTTTTTQPRPSPRPTTPPPDLFGLLGQETTEAPRPTSITDLFDPDQVDKIDQFVAYLLYPHLFQPPAKTNTIVPPEDDGLQSTSPPPYYPAHIIPDSGPCDPFQKVANTRAPGGQLFLNVDVEECKRICYLDDACEAVDHNPDVDLCIVHDAEDMEMYSREFQECCDHYHKTHCEAKTCYTHGILDLSRGDMGHVENISPASPLPAGVVLQQCDGGCYVEEIIIIADNGTTLSVRQMSRGCLPGGGLPFGRLCETSQQEAENGDQTYVTVCDCGFDRCNALGQSALQGLALYLPFDGNTQDYSGSIRHALDYGVQYDSAQSRRNISAYFDGESYAVVTSITGYLPGVISGPDGMRTPSLTITAWFRRQGDGDDVMSVLSNGIIEVWSENVGGIQNVLASVMLEDGVGYTVQGLVELEVWVFVVVRVTYGATPDVAELQLFLNHDEIVTDIPHNLLELPPVPVMQSIFPLYVGKHPLRGNYFHGFVDEVFLFSDALSSEQILTVRNLADADGANGNEGENVETDEGNGETEEGTDETEESETGGRR